MSNFKTIFCLSAFLLVLSGGYLQAMDERITIKSGDMKFFPQNSLFLPIYNGDKEVVEMRLEEASQKENINIEINGGALNGYTALRLAIDLWHGKVAVKRVSGHKKQAYKEIAQILVDNGAKFTGDMKESLEKMGITLPVQSHVSIQGAPAASAQEMPEFPELLPLFSAVYKGEAEVVGMLLDQYGQKPQINSRIESEGKYKGYTALMLAIDLWKETEDPTEKENYKKIAQILVDNGAIYLEAIADDLAEMDVTLTGTEQIGARPRHPGRRSETRRRLHREQFQEVDDLSKLGEEPK